jgi:hypothetical protein
MAPSPWLRDGHAVRTSNLAIKDKMMRLAEFLRPGQQGSFHLNSSAEKFIARMLSIRAEAKAETYQERSPNPHHIHCDRELLSHISVRLGANSIDYA